MSAVASGFAPPFFNGFAKQIHILRLPEGVPPDVCHSTSPPFGDCRIRRSAWHSAFPRLSRTTLRRRLSTTLLESALHLAHWHRLAFLDSAGGGGLRPSRLWIQKRGVGKPTPRWKAECSQYSRHSTWGYAPRYTAKPAPCKKGRFVVYYPMRCGRCGNHLQDDFRNFMAVV